MEDLHGYSAVLWAPEKAGVWQSFLICLLQWGHYIMHGLCSNSAVLGALKKQGEAAGSDFYLPLGVGDRGEGRGYKALPASFAPRRYGSGNQFPLENAGVQYQTCPL